MPMAMSVNMFRLRLTIDAQPRSKNGRPQYRTTGVASRSSTQAIRRAGAARAASRAGTIPDIAIRRSGAVRTQPTRKRRVMSLSSALSSS